MIVNKKPTASKIEIDLSGPEGNAFHLLGIASKLSRKLGMGDKMTQRIQLEMTSSDYSNLINVFDNYFGDYVILYKTF